MSTYLPIILLVAFVILLTTAILSTHRLRRISAGLATVSLLAAIIAAIPYSVGYRSAAPRSPPRAEAAPPALLPPREERFRSRRAANPLEVAASSFRKLPVLYRKPSVLDYNEASVFAVTIASADIEAARETVAAYTGEETEVSVRLSNSVRAALWAPEGQAEIKLKSGTPERDVSRAANTTWRWSVTPKTPGYIMLELDLYNRVRVNGTWHEIDGPAYADNFKVRVSIIDAMIIWFTHLDPIVQWLSAVATLIGTLYAGWKVVSLWFRQGAAT